MPQVSLYLKDKTFEKVKRAAKAESVSVSKWVSQKLETTIAAEWPDGFGELFGAIDDESFVRPEGLPYETDADREAL